MSQPTGDAQSGNANTQSGDGQNGSGNGNPDNSTSTNDNGNSTQSGTDANAGKVVSQAEYDQVRARMQAADRRASEFEQQLKQIRDKDLPEAEKLKRDHEEAVAKAEKAEKDLQELRINNAFLSDNTYKWRNPAVALRLLDRSKVTIDSDGNVSGMKDALKALADSEKYLLEDAQGSDGDSNRPNGTPGTAPANNGGAGGTKDPKARTMSRFPAMRTRA